MDTLLLIRDILAQEIESCCNLVTLSEQEKVAIIGNDVQALASIVEKKQTALTIMQKLKVKRDDLIDSIYTEENMGDSRQHLDDIIQTAQDTIRNELADLVDKLEKTIITLKSANALNKMLIDTQQKYTSFSINLLTGQDTSPGTYSVSGHRDEAREANQRLVDQAI